MDRAKLYTRDYEAHDRSACIAVFDSNVPKFFGALERPVFESYLTVLPGPYLVIEDRAEIVACGGVAPHKSEAGTAVLCWGMVLQNRHKTGLGRLLLLNRLIRLNSDPSMKVAVLNTSQFCAGFFAKMGFETRRVIPNGYFQGMDKHEMSVSLPFRIAATPE